MSWRFRKNDATSGRSEAFSFVLPFGFFSRRRNAMSLVSLASVRTPCAGHAESLTARVGGLEPRPTVWPSLPFKGEGRLNLRLIRIDIPLEEALTMPIHNVVRLRASASLFADDSSGVRFSAFMPKYLAAHTAFHVLDDERLVLYFRQNAGKGTTFTVRHLNVTDSWTKQAKLFLAWAASKLAFWIDPILLHEKNGRHYEESGWSTRGARTSASLSIEASRTSSMSIRAIGRGSFTSTRSRITCGSSAAKPSWERRPRHTP